MFRRTVWKAKPECALMDGGPARAAGGAWRDALAWITSHTFRKTAATILDEAALSARLVADQLGHSRPSMMIPDVYMGRRVVGSPAALALEAALRGIADLGEKHGISMTNDEGQQP